MPYYNRKPKRDHNFDNHQYGRNLEEQVGRDVSGFVQGLYFMAGIIAGLD